MIGERHAEHLSIALRRLVGDPVRGSVTFLRCLSSDLLDALIDAPSFGVEGWTVAAVVDKAGPRRITADQAVEQREDKAEPVIFLIDPLRAGAGLDGIYSAAHEITEAQLFKEAQREARFPLRGRRGFADMAVKRAQRLGRRHRLTPWQVFDFLVAVEKNGAGAALAGLGLWPIASDGAPSDENLSVSAALSDRLLFVQDVRPPGDGAVGEVVGIGGWRNLRLVRTASTGVVAPGEITP